MFSKYLFVKLECIQYSGYVKYAVTKESFYEALKKKKIKLISFNGDIDIKEVFKKRFIIIDISRNSEPDEFITSDEDNEEYKELLFRVRRALNDRIDELTICGQL